MNISQTNSDYSHSGIDDNQLRLAEPPMLNQPPSQTTNAQGGTLSYGDATIQSPFNPVVSGQNSSSLQSSMSQGSSQSQGMMVTIEQYFIQFLQQLQALLGMSSGQTQPSSSPLPSLSSDAGSMMPTLPTSSQGLNQTPSVRLASTGTTNTDTSMNTSDPDLQKLVDKFGTDYQAASQATGVPAKLLIAQTMQESGGDVNATSTNPGNGKTDTGMNQINPDTYAAMRAEHPDKLGANISDPKNQIMCAALMLQEGKQKFGSYDAALRAYNSGDDQVDVKNLSNVTLGDPNYVNEVNGYASKFN